MTPVLARLVPSIEALRHCMAIERTGFRTISISLILRRPAGQLGCQLANFESSAVL